MAAPTLTTAQKDALYNLTKQYYTRATGTSNCFEYLGKARRESYGYAKKTTTSDTTLNGCMNSSTGKYFLNCGLFAQMIWMGRKLEDFTSNLSTPTKSITKAFSWGYYFDFLPARNAYGQCKSDGSKYSFNTYPSGSSRPFITFDNAASMAQELYDKGYEIPYGEADIGDLVFYRAESLIDGDTDDLEESSFRNITHVGIVYDLTAAGDPIIAECTNVYSNDIMGKCGISTADGAIHNVKGATSPFGVVRGANLGFRNVMCARHPVAFGHTGNVPASFEPYRQKGE